MARSDVLEIQKSMPLERPNYFDPRKRIEKSDHRPKSGRGHLGACFTIFSIFLMTHPDRAFEELDPSRGVAPV